MKKKQKKILNFSPVSIRQFWLFNKGKFIGFANSKEEAEKKLKQK